MEQKLDLNKGFLIGIKDIETMTSLNIVGMIGYLEYKRRTGNQGSVSYQEYKDMDIEVNGLSEYFHDIRISSSYIKMLESLAFYLGVQYVDMVNMVKNKDLFFINQYTLEIKRFDTGRKDPNCNDNFKTVMTFADAYISRMRGEFSGDQVLFKKEWDYFQNETKPKLILMYCDNIADREIYERGGHVIKPQYIEEEEEKTFDNIKRFLYETVKYYSPNE